MEYCRTTQQITAHLNQEAANDALEEYKQNLIETFKDQILQGDIVTIGNSHYSFDDVLSEVAGDKAIDIPLQMLLINDPSEGGLTDETAGHFIRTTMNRYLDSLLNDMADCQMTLLEQEANDHFEALPLVG